MYFTMSRIKSRHYKNVIMLMYNTKYDILHELKQCHGHHNYCYISINVGMTTVDQIVTTTVLLGWFNNG